LNDVLLKRDEVVRIYDIVFDYKVLLDTDAFYRKILFAPEFQHEMGTAEFHHLIGRVVAERQRALGLSRRSLIAAAYEYGVPVYTSSPGDSSIGMNVAALAIEGCKLKIDMSRDVNETAAIVLGAKRSGGKSGVLILGGGSPKNFVLQTEPQVQEVLGIEEKGHDYYIQFTDARVDTGGLSGATPSEAVSWGKVDPDRLPDTVVCYCDSTIALPLISAYALANHPPRRPKRLYERREALMAGARRGPPIRPSGSAGAASGWSTRSTARRSSSSTSPSSASRSRSWRTAGRWSRSSTTRPRTASTPPSAARARR